jgi:hypothetical protein
MLYSRVAEWWHNVVARPSMASTLNVGQHGGQCGTEHERNGDTHPEERRTGLHGVQEGEEPLRGRGVHMSLFAGFYSPSRSFPPRPASRRHPVGDVN